MSMHSASACLDRALSLLGEALVGAEAGDWERVADLDARCRQASRDMVDELAGEDAAPLAERLRQLSGRHHRLLALAEAQRERLVEARRQSVRGRQGTRVYEDNA